VSKRQITNAQNRIKGIQMRIGQREAQGKPTRNLKKILSEYRTELSFYKADTPEKVKALKHVKGVAYTEKDAKGRFISTTNKPKEVKIEKPKTEIKPRPTPGPKAQKRIAQTGTKQTEIGKAEQTILSAKNALKQAESYSKAKPVIQKNWNYHTVKKP